VLAEADVVLAVGPRFLNRAEHGDAAVGLSGLLEVLDGLPPRRTAGGMAARSRIHAGRRRWIRLPNRWSIMRAGA
jgi:hypothetical protein